VAVQKVDTVSVVVVVVVEMLEVGLEEPLVLPPTEVEVDESRETGREIGRARGPTPVTLTFRREERVLPLESGLGEFVTEEVGEKALLRKVD